MRCEPECEHRTPRGISITARTISAVAGEAVHRLISGAPAIQGVPVIIVSVISAAAMIACALILGDVGGDLNMESLMLDAVADAAAAIGVVVSGAVILLGHGVYWLDSLVALVIAIVVGSHAMRLMRRAIKQWGVQSGATAV